MMMDQKGNKLFRKVIVRIIFPDEIFPSRVITQNAGPKMGFHAAGIDEILMKIADQLEELYPYWEFNAVELTPIGKTARYALTFAGYRASSGRSDTPPPPVLLDPSETVSSMPSPDPHACSGDAT